MLKKIGQAIRIGLNVVSTFIPFFAPIATAAGASSQTIQTVVDDLTKVGGIIQTAEVFGQALDLKGADKLKEGSKVDLGKPAEWGPDCILDLDSLASFSDAAFDWAESMNPSAKDPRQ